MKRKLIAAVLIMACTFTLACGKDTPAGTESGETNNASDEVVIPDTNKYGTVTLGKYKGIEAEKKVYTITDDQIEAEIATLIDGSKENERVDRAAENGDYLEFFFTASIDGEVIFDYSDEVYFLTLGEEELGPELDQKLIGAKEKDHLSFSIAYDDTAFESEFAKKTVDYEVDIEGVYAVVVPELTTELIKSLGYESEEDMRAQIKAELEEKAENTSLMELEGSLLQTVMTNATVEEYNEEMYAEAYDSVKAQYEAYIDYFGDDYTLEDIYALFGISEEDVENEAISNIYEHIIIEEIAIQEKIGVSDAEYQSALEIYAEMDEYEDLQEYEDAVGADNLRFWILEGKVLDFLVQNAKITEVEGVMESDDSTDEYYDTEFDDSGDVEDTEEYKG